MNALIQAFVLLFQAGLGMMVGYLLLLTAASLRAEGQTSIPATRPTKRFAILIPAHNEESLLPDLLLSLSQIDYPKPLYEIDVVADNCTDHTARVAKNGGANVFVRVDQENPGKGPALQWLLARLRETSGLPDAIVILDADSVVSPNFLSIMAARLQNGERVIQAYYTVRNPESSWSGGLRYAALAVLHFLRPQGRMKLGGSAGLKGNGMVFVGGIFETYAWSASITEDIDLHMALLLNGERVTFAPDAVVQGEMPDTLTSSKSQHMRWESGRLQMCRKYLPVLLKKTLAEGLRGHFDQAYLLFDAAMEHLIPPFSIMLGFPLLFLFGNLTLIVLSIFGIDHFFELNSNLQVFNVILSGVLLSGMFVYLVIGLWLVHAPRNIYRDLCYSPVYMVWKFFQYSQSLLSKGQQSWVRTSRNVG